MTLTEAAIKKIAALREPNQQLRVTIAGGGCSGLSYKMEFVSGYSTQDDIIFTSSFVVVADKRSALFLKDVALDYEDGLNGKGFAWSNPNARRTCGCGESFSV